MLANFLRNYIFVGNSPSHEKYLLLDTHGLCHGGQTLLCHLNQILFLLLGVIANDNQPKEKFDNIVDKLDSSGNNLKQAKPMDNEKLKTEMLLHPSLPSISGFG